MPISDQLKMHSPNLVDTNIEKIAALFPNCVTEAQGENGELKKAIDFDLLKQELSQVIVEGEQERYRLDWVGKKEAILTANAPIAKTLRPCREESVNFDKTENLFIEGDNLEALKLLQENYLGKVKMIYIDPPYNTGNDFIYEDDFSKSTEEFFEKSHQTDDEGNRLIANTDSNGRFHSDWLSMMYSRLKLARNVLTEDGIVFISCDDNELDNLLKISNEIFGEINFIGIFSVENNPKGRKNSSFISVSNEYCVVFSKDIKKSYFIENIPKKSEDMKIDENGNYVHASGKRVLVGNNSFNEVVKDISSEKHYSVYFNSEKHELILIKEDSIYSEDISLKNKGYKRYFSSRGNNFIENTYTKNKFIELFNSKSLEFSSDKIFEKNYSDTIRIKSLLVNREYEGIVNGQKQKCKFDFKTTSAGTHLKEIFNSSDVLFPAPKTVNLIKTFISLFESKDFIIMDFYAGSGTTAEAVIETNSEDNGSRKFILVQLDEVIEKKSVAYKAGYNCISDLSKERIRRSGNKILEDNATKEGIENLDIGFRVLKIDSTNMKDVYYTPDALKQSDLLDLASNIKEDRTSEDLLFQVMLDWGLELSLPIERKTVAGKEVFYVAGNSLVACFDELTFDIVDEVAKDLPLRFVSAEKAIHLDHDKTNIKERFKQLSPDTEVKFL